MDLTIHAQERSQQRHICQQQLDWLITYGQAGHNRGVCLYFFDREGFSQLIREVEPSNQTLAMRSRNIYAVVAQSKVITVGYRDERLKSQKPHKRVRRGMPSLPAARRTHYRTH